MYDTQRLLQDSENQLATPENPLAVRQSPRFAGTISKPSEDGFVSSLINRRLSSAISQWLVTTSITPNIITVVSFLICIAGAFLFGMGQYLYTALAGILVQFASIIDGCDGEVARMRLISSPFGACLDTILDRYADAAVVVGITYAYWVRHPDPAVWVVGLFALAGFILASYTKKEYRIRYQERPPAGVLEKLSKRDLRLFGIMAGALINHPFEAMVALGFVSHLWVTWSFLVAYARTRSF